MGRKKKNIFSKIFKSKRIPGAASSAIPPLTPNLRMEKGEVIEILKSLITELCQNQKYTVSFVFDNTSIYLERGELIAAQLIQTVDNDLICFYLDAIVTRFKTMENISIIPLTHDYLDKMTKFLRPIVSAQLFNLSKPKHYAN